MTWDHWDACEIAADGSGVFKINERKVLSDVHVIPRADGSILYAADLTRKKDAPQAAFYSADSTGKISVSYS